MANFSPQVGSELKGKHFAIVLTKKDRFTNELLTVIPLTSKAHKYHLDLDSEIKKAIFDKINDIPMDDEDKHYAVLKRYETLKEHTYAKVHQITTISKLRVLKPVNDLDPIRKLRVSDETMDKLDAKIKELFTRDSK